MVAEFVAGDLFGQRHLAQDVSADAGAVVCHEESGDFLPADGAVARDGTWNEADDLVAEVLRFEQHVAVAGPPLLEHGDQRASLGVGRLDLGDAIDRVAHIEGE